jgi:putative ABC transport system permease protein
MWWETIRMSLVSIAENRMRSFLTTLGIIFGVMAIISVVSIVQGVFYVYTSQLEGLGAGFLFIMPGNQQTTEQVRANPRISLEDARVLEEKVDAVLAASPYAMDRRRMQERGQSTEAVVMPVSERYQEILNHYVDDGRFFTAYDIRSRARSMVVGPDLAEKLGLQNPVGKMVRLYGTPFRVVGMMEEKDGVNFMGQQYDQAALIPFTTGEAMGARRGQGGILLVKLRDAKDTDWAKEEIRRVLRRQHGLAPGEPDDFTMVTQSELLATVGNLTGLATGVVMAIVAVALLVGGIGIMNIMLVSVTERTREIGLRMAVGARRRDILTQFLLEAAMLGFFGGVLGIGLGYVMSWAATWIVPEFPPPYVPLWAVAMGFFFSVSVGLFFGAYPAAKASKLDPIDALRFE